jgi:hypothetical protein
MPARDGNMMLLVRFGSDMSPHGVSIPVIGWDKGDMTMLPLVNQTRTLGFKLSVFAPGVSPDLFWDVWLGLEL